MSNPREDNNMANDEQEVVKAAQRFYDAIESMVSGRGLEPMREAWHHTDRVTGGHPSGEWAQGWEEVWATWEVFSSFGREDRGGSSIRNLRAYVYGDVAYTTCVFMASPGFGGDTLSCTNVLQRIDGQWKVIHHHADKSPAMGAALERIARGG
jgi:ketosteroid isomerase-like protein